MGFFAPLSRHKARPIAVITALTLILAAVPALATGHHKRRHHRTLCVAQTHHRSRSLHRHGMTRSEPICRSSQTLFSIKHQGKPSPPSNLTAAPGNSQVHLSWGISTVSGSTGAGYRVYRNRTQAAQVATATYTDSGLVNGNSYSYYTVAYTSSGSLSSASNTVTATPADTTPPTTPSGLTTSGISSPGATLSWSPSSDASGVAGYNVYLDSMNVATTTQAPYGFTGLACGTTYALGVSASDPTGKPSAVATSTFATNVCAPANTTPPSVSGSPQQGQTLTASPGWWTNSPTSYAYQWQHCLGGVCTNVSGATSSSYALQSSDVGDTIDVVVTATNATGSTSASSPIAALLAAPANATPPSISGSAQQGQTLTASPGTWTNSRPLYAYRWQDCTSSGCTNIGGATNSSYAPKISGVPRVGNTLTVNNGTWSNSPTSYTYQWQDCNAQGGGCSNIDGATSSSYTVASTDTASSIKAVVTASNAAGFGTASAITGPEPVNFAIVSYASFPTEAGSVTLDAQRYRIIDLTYSNQSKSTIQTAEAANPNLKALLYNLPGVTNSSYSGVPANRCVDYTNVAYPNATARPGNSQYDWFLYNSVATSLTGSSSGHINEGGNDVGLDVGNMYYQNSCNSNILSKFNNSTDGGFNGGFWDNVETSANQFGTIAYYNGSLAYLSNNTPNPTPVSCPVAADSTNSWICADERYLTNTKNYLASARAPTFAIANTAISHLTELVTTPSAANADSFITLISTAASGTMREGWMIAYAQPSAQDPYYPGNLSNALWSEANNRVYMALPVFGSGGPSASEAGNVYTLAGALMAMNGYTDYTLDQTHNDTWYTDYNTALQLGPATSGLQIRTDSNGHIFYERDFSNGVVVVNPSQNSIAPFSPTPGGTYSGNNCDADTASCSKVSSVSSLTLNTDGAAILLRP